MQALDIAGMVLLVVCAFLLALVLRRRWLSRQGGTVEMSLRMRRRGPGRTGSYHWTFGVARFEQERLVWFRTFSLSPRPRHVLRRPDLVVRHRRPPHGAEVIAMAADAVVLECHSADSIVEIALPSSAALGFLSWLEAAPTRASA